MAKKLLIMATHAEENPEKATLPFVMGTAALSSEMEVIIGVQSMGVYLAMKDYARHVHAEGFPPLEELLESFLELGGKIYVCGPCIRSRKIDPLELIEGAKVVNAPTFANAMAEADAQISY